MNDKLYFQDIPVEEYSDDFIGFNEEINMIKEGVESNSKIIGLVSDYGSGKSSIINLLDKELSKKDYDLIRVNLWDPDGKNSGLEAHKRMIIQLANNIYNNKPKKVSYIIKKINPNYRTINISTKNNISFFCVILSLLLFIISFCYKNNVVLHYLNFLSDPKYYDYVKLIKEICNYSGILGFIILFITIICSGIVCNYFIKDDVQTINELDLIDVSTELKTKKKLVIVIEDLDRIDNKEYIVQFIKELNTYYKNLKNAKFIIAITPEEFEKMSNESDDSKYKPFNLIINLPKIKNSDYSILLKELLLSKKDLYSKKLGIKNEQDFDEWEWLSLGDNLNMRRLKHRINSTVHLYMSLKSRFPNKDINIRSCIAIIYLRDRYEEEFNDLLIENDGSFELKNKLDNWIKMNKEPEKLSGIDKDIYELFVYGYIDYNCEMYCYNYSRYNTIFGIDENSICTDYLLDRSYSLPEEKIKSILESNSDCLNNAMIKRENLKLDIPSNVFDSVSIINFILKKLNEDKLTKFYTNLLPIDYLHISSTKGRLEKILNSDFFLEENTKKYISTSADNIRKSGNYQDIDKSRKALIDIFTNCKSILLPLYENDFPIISEEELNSIDSLKDAHTLIHTEKIDANNINYIINAIDKKYEVDDNDIIINIIDNLKTDMRNYYLKNCKSLSLLDVSEKEKIYSDYSNDIAIESIDDVEKIIENFNYSFEDLELKAINYLDTEIIKTEQYDSFVNRLPNVSKKTLERLEKDDCLFEVNDNIINAFKENNMMYGYVKFLTFKKNEIPKGNKAITNEYEKIYSNNNFIFDKFMNNTYFLEYIRDHEIYSKYDNHRFMYLKNCSQTEKLIKYSFQNLDTVMLNDYLETMNYYVLEDEVFEAILDKYQSKIINLSKIAYEKLLKCTSKRGNKIKLAHMWRTNK